MANLPDLVAAAIVIAAIVALYVLAGSKRRSGPRTSYTPHAAWKRQSWEPQPKSFGASAHDTAPIPALPATEAELAIVSKHLAAVMHGGFDRQRILNRSEYRVFCIVERALRAHNGYRVFPQTSLGEVLQSPDKEAFMAINAKRVDLLVVDGAGWPVLAIEYQGEGHYQGVAIARDAIKKEALRKAGVRYIEVMAGDSDDKIVARLGEELDPGSRVAALSS